MTPDAKRTAIAERAKKGASKIDRSAFLYMVDHDGDAGATFAQCAGCRFFTGDDDGKCAVLDVAVQPGWSCGMFADGHYSGETIAKSATPEEAGVYKGSVRCENCRFGGKHCALYQRLNKEMPGIFDLDTKIESKACCNAFQPRTA